MDAKSIYQNNSPKDYIPPRVRLGDIDSDGYPDILVTIQYSNGTSIPHILLNEKLVNSIPTKGLSDEDYKRIDKESKDQKDASLKDRHFSLNENVYTKVLGKYQNAKYALFFDMIESSMIDLIVVSKKSVIRTDNELEEGLVNMPYISAIYNNLNTEMFYIKARMLTDSKIGGPLRQASFRAVLTDLNDDKFVVECNDNG